MQLEQVDDIGAEALETRVHGAPHVRGLPAVIGRCRLVSELRGDDGAVPTSS